MQEKQGGQMAEDTIVTDVEETEESSEGAVVETSQDFTSLSRRGASFQDVLESRKQELAEEYGPEVAGLEPDQEEAPVVAKPQVEDEEITLKVAGQEIKAPRSKVLEAGIATLQKTTAADQRLAAASAKEAELKAREESLKKMEQDLLGKRNQQIETEPDETGRAFADALFTDEDVVAKTITSLNRKLNEVTAKVEKVQQAEEGKVKATFESMVKHYHTNYGDISSDPDMHFALNRIKNEIRAANPELSPIQLVDQAATVVYQKFGIKKGEPVQEQKSARTQAKERMPAPIKRATARMTPAPEDPPKKPSEILDMAHKGRGQGNKY